MPRALAMAALARVAAVVGVLVCMVGYLKKGCGGYGGLCGPHHVGNYRCPGGARNWWKPLVRGAAAAPYTWCALLPHAAWAWGPACNSARARWLASVALSAAYGAGLGW